MRELSARVQRAAAEFPTEGVGYPAGIDLARSPVTASSAGAVAMDPGVVIWVIAIPIVAVIAWRTFGGRE